MIQIFYLSTPREKYSRNENIFRLTFVAFSTLKPIQGLGCIFVELSPRVTRSKARGVAEEDSSQQVMPISRVKKRPTARRGRRGARVGARGYQMPRSREYTQVVGERDTSTPTSDTSETVQGKTSPPLLSLLPLKVGLRRERLKYERSDKRGARHHP